jgi:hypothetical protein
VYVPDRFVALIRAKLADGRLSRANLPRVWGEPGKGETCIACDEVIAKSNFVIEGVEGLPAAQFQVRRFYVWDTERDAPGR